MSWPSPSIIALVYAIAACWAVSKLPMLCTLPVHSLLEHRNVKFEP